MMDLLAAVAIIIGTALMCLAGLGLVKLPDVLLRMAAISKATTLALVLSLGAVAVIWNDWHVTWKLATVIAFIVMTVPTTSHLIGRAAVRRGVKLFPKTQIVDDAFSALYEEGKGPRDHGQ